jgi:hypothetical protein
MKKLRQITRYAFWAVFNSRPLRGIKKITAVYAATFTLTLILVLAGAALLNHYSYAQYLPRVPKTNSINTVSVAEIVIPVNEVQADEPRKGDETFEAKLKTIEEEMMGRLSKCESGTVKEQNAAVILDTNNEHSFGKYMWQIKSVQHYVDKFYHKKIDRRTAILIALDAYPEIPVDELTRRVLFEAKNNAADWYNCAQKLGLPGEINLLNKFR